MVGSANINQKWLMCQVSPENRRKRRACGLKCRFQPKMFQNAKFYRKWSKMRILTENGGKRRFSAVMVKNGNSDQNWSKMPMLAKMFEDACFVLE